MKGLLLKDFYLAQKHCRSYILVAGFFLVMAVLGTGNLFFMFYPSIFVGMLPVTLLGYDERSGWDKYCGTLPYTKAQIVSAKYILGLIMQVLVTVVVLAALAVRGMLTAEIAVTLVALSSLAASICLPFMFRYGVEKGRIAYYIMVGAICGGSAFASNMIEWQIFRFSGAVSFLLPLLSLGILALSWLLSIRFYEKREF
ncbi:MAG: ABC-2 transporter permease [Oscillospiraceae bacterium]|nr:ABC-2 transporter permease [Oscillospiraceae bacterium]